MTQRDVLLATAERLFAERGIDGTSLRAVMAEHDILIEVDMGLGDAEATVWSCDFSYEYVKINGEYHT